MNISKLLTSGLALSSLSFAKADKSGQKTPEKQDVRAFKPFMREKIAQQKAQQIRLILSSANITITGNVEREVVRAAHTIQQKCEKQALEYFEKVNVMDTLVTDSGTGEKISRIPACQFEMNVERLQNDSNGNMVVKITPIVLPFKAHEEVQQIVKSMNENNQQVREEL